AAANPLYTAAYEAGDNVVWTQGLERLSASPTVQNAMRGAVRVWQDNAIADGFGAMNPGALVEGGNLKFLSGKVPAFPNLQFWDYTKRIIDDQIGEAVRAGKDQKARTLTRLVQVMRNEIDEGRKILAKTASADEMGAAFRALSPSEQEGFRIGAVSRIIATLGNDP